MPDYKIVITDESVDVIEGVASFPILTFGSKEDAEFLSTMSDFLHVRKLAEALALYKAWIAIPDGATIEKIGPELLKIKSTKDGE